MPDAQLRANGIDPPTNELGHGNTGLTPWSAFVDVTETVRELAWPNSINTYSAMRTDAQIASLLLAFTLPIRRYRWFIDPNGARDEVVEDVANDFNLPIGGQDPKPITGRRDRFSHERHLFHALLMLTYGHVFFEQVYQFDDAARRFRLRKLAPRMPGTISEIQVAHDGGLDYIHQFPSGRRGIDEAVPLLKYEKETDKRYSVADMKALIDVGALTTDPELEAYIRAEGDLPKKSEEDQQVDDGRRRQDHADQTGGAQSH